MQVGQQGHLRAGGILRQQRLLHVADHQGDVGCVDQGQFQCACPCCRAMGRGIAGQCGCALLAQVVQIDGVEQHPRLRCVTTQQRQELPRHVMTADHHRVKPWPVFAQPCRDACCVGGVPAFNAKALKGTGVVAVGAAIGGQKDHVRAFLDQQPHQFDHAQGAGVAIRAWGQCVDQQDLLAPSVQQGRGGYGGWRQLLGQGFTPLVQEYRAVARLCGLGAAVGVGAGGGALIVHHDRCRLVKGAKTGGTDREGKVGVFVIGRGVAGVEAAQCRKQLSRQGNGGTAEVIGLAQVLMATVVRILKTPVVPPAAIGEHHPACFLQAAIGIHQFRANQTRTGVLGECVKQRIQPAGLGHGVIVQEDEIFALGQLGAVIASGDESPVALTGMQP